MIAVIKQQRFFSIFLILLRILTGLVFVFSGFVKGIDPLGTTYKLTDYFDAFHMGFLGNAALLFSIILNMAEFVMGIALLMGIFEQYFIWMALLFIAVFTPLTLFLAIYNPITDCGCFGDAIIMTNWQTFYKNIAISALVIILFIFRKNIVPVISLNKQRAILCVSIISFLILSIYTYRHLPIIDFRPYKKGVYLHDGMIIPKGAQLDSFQISLLYQKDGIIKEFTMDNIPWQDTAWKWVETKNKLIKPGYHPPIHDFSITGINGEEITDTILYDTSFIFLAITHDLEKASQKDLESLKKIYLYCMEHQHKFYCVTASASQIINNLKDSLSLPFQFFSADDIMLKTVVRSNPGLVLIKNGTILAKWHHNDFPCLEKHSNLLSLIGKENRNIQQTQYTVLFFSLLMNLILIVLFICKKTK